MNRPSVLLPQRFVELVSAGRLDAALAMGRSELAGAARTADEEEHLLDCLSLLAYDPPSCGPSGHLLSASHRCGERFAVCKLAAHCIARYVRGFFSLLACGPPSCGPKQAPAEL